MTQNRLLRHILGIENQYETIFNDVLFSLLVLLLTTSPQLTYTTFTTRLISLIRGYHFRSK